jgi:hypothetical protein
MSLLYKKLISRIFTFFVIFSPVSYGEEAGITNYDKGILATEWSSFHDVAFAVIVIFVVLIIIVFMKTPDDIV